MNHQQIYLQIYLEWMTYMYLIHLLVVLHRSKLHVPDQNVIRFKKKKAFNIYDSNYADL